MNETTTPTVIDWTRLPYGAREALDPSPWMSAADAVARVYASDSSWWAEDASDGQGNGAAIVLISDVDRRYLAVIGIELPVDRAAAILVQWDDRGFHCLSTGTEVDIRDVYESERARLEDCPVCGGYYREAPEGAADPCRDYHGDY